MRNNANGVLLPGRKVVEAVLRNQAHRAGLDTAARSFLNLRPRAGNRWNRKSCQDNIRYIKSMFGLFAPHAGDFEDKVGLEIGPGDNTGVGYCFLKYGAARMYGVESCDSISEEWNHEVMSRLDDALDTGRQVSPDQMIVINDAFEDVELPPEHLDFIYSNDVFEHITRPEEVFQKAHDLLKPGGLFINSIDLRGHNVFSNKERPLDFLTCPDDLWEMMFSHIVTTNRLRLGDFRELARRHGFVTMKEDVLDSVSDEYIDEIRPRLLERYRSIPNEELRPVQVLFVWKKSGD